MYRTGDVGRLTPDGDFEFLGRRDDQVKLRGYRIELGDIEANAMTMPDVKLAAAALRTRERSGPYIALFVEPKEGALLDGRRLREHLSTRLPEHMVPGLAAIGVVDKLPLNQNGKIDRKRLPMPAEPAIQRAESEGGSLGAQIEAIWCHYLQVANIDQEDDFVALGGHSLIAIQIISQINDRFGISVPVVKLLRGGSLRWFIDTVAGTIDAKSKITPTKKGPSANQAAGKLHQVVLADGRIISAPYPEEAHHYYNEVIERDVYLRRGIAVDDGAVIIDVGANIGLFTLAMLARSSGSRVVAIEPVPILASAMKENLRNYARDVTLLQVGLYDREGEREFTFYPSVTGMSSFEPDAVADRALLAGLINNARDANASLAGMTSAQEAEYLDARLISETLTLPVERLSGIVDRLDLERIDLLKIDVQRGSERVLDGINPEHWRRIRQVVVEHQAPLGRRSVVEERLAALGYTVATEQDRIHRDTTVVYTYAWRAP